MMDEQQFWDSTPSLRYVFDYARAKQVAPWATLFVVLARISVAVPPHVVTPPLICVLASWRPLCERCFSAV